MSDEFDFTTLSDQVLADTIARVEMDDAWVTSELELLRKRKRDNSYMLEALYREDKKRQQKLEWEQKQAEIAKLYEDPEFRRRQEEFSKMMREGHVTWDPTIGHWKCTPWSEIPEFTGKRENEFHFIHERITKADQDLYFGEGAECTTFTDAWTMANIVVHIGLFPSLTQARKNGYDKPIEQGWSDLTMGKKKLRVCILNWHPCNDMVFPEDDEPLPATEPGMFPVINAPVLPETKPEVLPETSEKTLDNPDPPA